EPNTIWKCPRWVSFGQRNPVKGTAKQNRILQKLGIEPTILENFKIFLSSLNTILQYNRDLDLRSLKDWEAPVLSNLGKLNQEEISYIESELSKGKISISGSQVQVQKLIPPEERKRLAAYYTINQGIDFMEKMVFEYLKICGKQKIVIADPFLGAGRTLTAAIRKIGTQKLEKVWGIEPTPLPALVAYASILQAVRGKKEIIKVVTGDTFKEVPQIINTDNGSKTPRADIILTNPPFTRWKYLEKSHREYLLKVISELGYGNYITRREESLQALSMFLADYVLNNDGLLVSVLPASTFYTIYGRGYKSLLKENYDVLGVLELANRPSFSEDSGFKEIIIVAVKGANKRGLTLFTELNNDVEKTAKQILKQRELITTNSFNIHDLPQFLDINWLSLFGESKLRDIIVIVFKQGLKQGTLGYWNQIQGRQSIIRGVEMYGPEFFFIPNKHWNIIKENEKYAEIENVENKNRLSLSKKFLVRTLRKPGLYRFTIEASVDSYMLSIPPTEINNLSQDLQFYIKWGIESRTAKPALNAYGKHWYSHVHKQMVTKKPFGHVFLPDKVDPTFKRRGVFANHSEEKVAASKNFYITREENRTISKILVAWFNSTIFISTFMLLGRKISERWNRFLENDYLELPIINTKVIDMERSSEICNSIKNMIKKPLPPIWNQLNEKYRQELDLSLLNAIKIENPKKMLEEIYQTLGNQKFNTQPHKTLSKIPISGNH
ncbi:MAG: N-6 DNA methylase, partial [Candidatus Jordarchaeum sp.]|uniref:N-6 DNA methylase n=1 Tax=Candidatus Jordarchaeum sp. TaxID=2823881 RepID=UPI00404B5DCF